MGASSGPDLVTRGLEIFLDAGNPASYSGSGSTWRDISGNGRNFTLVGSPQYSTESVGYFTLNGTSQYFTSTHSTNYTSAISFSLWVLANSTSGKDPLLFNKSEYYLNNQNGQPYQLHFNNGGTRTNSYIGNNVYVTPTVSGVNFTDRWIHVASTWDSSSARVYINGVQAASASTVGQTMSSNSLTWTLGRANTEYAGGVNSSYFLGRIAIAKIYSVTLSPSEVYQNYVAMRGRYGL